MKLTRVQYEMVVNTTPKKAWEILADFGNVGKFHPQLESSKSVNGSAAKAELGCDRECVITDGKKKIYVKEKIIDYVEGQYYTYDFYEWKNFPLNKSLNTFGVKMNGEGKTVIYSIINYRLKPGFLTILMKGKVRSSARESLLGYKHYLETGEIKADMKSLKERYRQV